MPATRKMKVVFVDDDEEERKRFRQAVRGRYKVRTFRWPRPRASHGVTWLGEPGVIVLDMYLPRRGSSESISVPDLARLEREALKIATTFCNFYRRRLHPKAQLRETMNLLERARQRVLDAQWKALGQSPDVGFDLLRDIRRHRKYRCVPVIFYSRKITVEDAVRAMDKGVRVVRKHTSPNRLLREIGKAAKGSQVA